VRAKEVADTIVLLQDSIENWSTFDFIRPFIIVNDIIVQQSDLLFACSFKKQAS